jgi:hypothetical protein
MVQAILEASVKVEAVLVHAQGRLQVQVVPPQVQGPHGEAHQGFRFAHQYERHQDTEVLQGIFSPQAVWEDVGIEENRP